MEALENIFTRRSVRRYTDQPITKEQEETLLKAGMCAQNTINKRTWAFIVLRDKQIIQNLSEGLKPNAPLLKNANYIIVVCGDLSLCKPGLEGFWAQDCSNSATNILLAANAMGLSGCWYGIFPQEYKVNNVKTLLQLPKHIIPLCALSIGYPNEFKDSTKIVEERYEVNKIHYDKW